MKHGSTKWFSMLIVLVFSLFLASASVAAEKPKVLKVAIASFLSGPASVFGIPAKDGGDIMVEDINKAGGIGGVPLELIYIDEGAGGEHVVSEFTRMVQTGEVEFTMAACSSGNCKKLCPLAEELQIPNIMWDCGTQAIFEEHSYKFNCRTQANATPEMLAPLIYLLKVKPDLKTIAVVNQDYAWGRDSWKIFLTALKTLKPDVKVVAEFFPKFGSPDFSAEISRLLALKPDAILNTSWGGDLDNFVRQSVQRGLTKRTLLVMPLAESSLQRLGKDMPEGQICGGRGDHYYLHPEYKDRPEFKDFMARFKKKTGVYPIYPVFHMSQALAALKKTYERAIEDNGGEWPNNVQLAQAMKGMWFSGLGRAVKIREDMQGLEDQLVGISKQVDGYDTAVLDDIMIFPAEFITTPVGLESVAWLKTLDKSILDIQVPHYKFGM